MNLDFQKGSRSRILAVLLLVIAAVFIVRLFYLQVIQHDYYTSLAGQEQIKQKTIFAERGLIYALDGDVPVPLVLNEAVYLVYADPVIVDDEDKVIETIRQVAGGSAKANLKELLGRKESRYQILATKLTRKQAEKIKEADLAGIRFQETTQRVYPEGGLAAQVLGYVNADGDGQYGVESGLADRLKGTDGLRKTVTDVTGTSLTIGDNNVEKPAKDGETLVLSLDRNIQAKAEQALATQLEKVGADHGSVVVIDPQTGKVMAMANLPTYSPATFNTVTDAAVFNNNIISNPYEPGSDIKTFTMAAGIDKGVVKASDTYNNTDYINVADRVISNATKGHTGQITFQTALNFSLNTGFVTVAQRLGDGNNITLQSRKTMYDYFHDRFRMGQLTGIELAGERPGTIISPDEVEGNAVRYSNMSFGQGMDVTMLQVAAGFSSIVNGGRYYQPSILAGTIQPDGTFKQTQAQEIATTVSSATSDQIREMTRIGRSTTFPGIDKAGYEVGGKTGTSQVVVNGQYSPTDTIGTYLGYGGGSTANYVIMVEVSGKGKAFGGSKDAMPIFTDISNWLLDYLKIQPKG